METKQTIEPEQAEHPEQSKEIIPDEKINTSDNKNERNAFSHISTIFKRIWTYVLQNPVGTGTLLIGIAAVLTVIFKVILPNTVHVMGTLTGGDISVLVQPGKPEESSKLGKTFQEIEKDPKASAIDQAIVDAYILQQTGKIDKAIEKWRSIAIVVERTNSDIAAGAWFAVGYLHQKEARWKKALSAYDKAIHLEQNNAKAYNNRGVVRTVFNQFEDAIKDYDKAIDLRPDFLHQVYYNRGNAKYSLKQYESALDDYNVAIGLKQDYAEAYSSRGLTKLSLGQYESALQDCNKAIDLTSDYAIAYTNRGLVKSALGQYESAIGDYKKAIRLMPDYTEAYAARGSAHIELDDLDSAIADFLTAVRLATQQKQARLKAEIERQIQGLNDIK